MFAGFLTKSLQGAIDVPSDREFPAVLDQCMAESVFFLFLHVCSTNLCQFELEIGVQIVRNFKTA